VIDGIDGSGKSTQTNILVKRLKAAKYPVETLNFPQYHQFFGRTVKKFLNGEFGKIDAVDPHLASVLYAFDRWQARNKINHWLKENKIVILNRYATSNVIHQTIKIKEKKQRQFINWLNKMEYEILKLPKPDLVLYLYLPYKLSYALITKRDNKKDIHEADLDHLKTAAAQGLKLAKSQQNWRLIRCNDGEKILSKEEIAEKIWKIISSNVKLQISNAKSNPNVK
ncbi:MAG: hypothetical protein AAB525_04065, partial [Patescibacteria group bacterium]